VLATAALTLHRLDAAKVCGANEAIEGVFVQQMVEHGVLLFPLENGSAPMYKPPLFHWTATALDRIARVNRVTAFNLRLPSAFYAVAGVVLTILFAWTPLGEGGAILAGLILAASYQYVSEGRVGRVDMTLTFFETLAMMSCLWILPPGSAASTSAETTSALSAGDIAMRYLFALALGLGVLAKGPVAVILPLGTICVFLLRERRLTELRDLFTPGSLFVATVVSLGWYVACAVGQRYGFLGRQLGSENFGRFFGALGYMAPWYYLKPLLLNSMPLSLLVPFAAAAALRRPGAGLWATGAPAEESRARFEARLFATFWLLTVIFFSVAAYKRRAYLLPLWPASAFLLAWGAGELAQWNRWGRAARSGLAALCAGLVTFNFFYLPRHEAAGCGGGSIQAAAAQINRTVGNDEPLYLYGFGDDPAPLLFYLDRDAPRVEGKLGDAPPGYVIVPQSVWNEHESEALDLKPVLSVEAGGDKLLLLRRGGAIGMIDRTFPRTAAILAARSKRANSCIPPLCSRCGIVRWRARCHICSRAFTTN
jgi:4-amino-4-deoxy-L-arabinose transferase-like glycosyltransferase